MKIVKKNLQDDTGLCAFVESLPAAQLYWMITTPPLGDDILDHALTCEKCSRRVQEAGDDALASTPPEEQAQYREAARRILRRESRQAGSTYREALALAASDEDEEESEEETAGRVPFATLNIEGVSIQALADGEGMVFLRGEAPTGAKKLYFGQDEFVLKRQDDSPEIEVENLGSVVLEQFLERQRGDPEKFPIRFGA
jgi:hypothetical protein